MSRTIPVAPLAAVLLLLVLAYVLTVGASGAPLPAHLVLSHEAAERSRLAVDLVLTPVGTQALATASRDGRPARLVAVTGGGEAAAVADAPSGQPGGLSLPRPDGKLARAEVDGVNGGAFSPGGAWLAVVDAAGSLWWVDGLSGEARQLSSGPFASTLTVTGDTVLGLRLDSVEAPLESAAVRVDSQTGIEAVVLGEDLVYGLWSLADGRLLAAIHRPGGGVDLVMTESGERLATLDSAGPDLDVSTDGRFVAWAADGRLHLNALPDGDALWGTAAVRGARPRFSPDGSLLLVEVADVTHVLDLEGHLLLAVPGQACWAVVGRGCER